MSYKEYQPKIAELASGSEAGYNATILFAIVSARVHFYDMPSAMEDIKKKGDQSRYLYGCKGTGFAYLTDDIPFQNDKVKKWQSDPDYFASHALAHYLHYPGLGLIKAGFVVQMVLGKIGCLDTHNMERFGISQRTIQSRSFYSWVATERYILACRKAGTPEYLWDSWCTLIAEKYPSHFDSTEEVSKSHWDVINNYANGG